MWTLVFFYLKEIEECLEAYQSCFKNAYLFGMCAILKTSKLWHWYWWIKSSISVSDVMAISTSASNACVVPHTCNIFTLSPMKPRRSLDASISSVVFWMDVFVNRSCFKFARRSWRAIFSGTKQPIWPLSHQRKSAEIPIDCTLRMWRGENLRMRT